MGQQMKKYFAEYTGTFCIVFFGTGSIVLSDQMAMSGAATGWIALGFGLSVMAMIYTFSKVSGAHFNPAVSFAFWRMRYLPKKEFVIYIASQILGAVTASGILRALFPSYPTLGSTLPQTSLPLVFGAEVLLTAILVFTILSFAAFQNLKPWLGLAVGMVVALEAFIAGPISEASMNPARSFAPALLSGHLDSIWLYLLAPMLGSIVALGFCRSACGPICCPKFYGAPS